MSVEAAILQAIEGLRDSLGKRITALETRLALLENPAPKKKDFKTSGEEGDTDKK